MAAQPLINEKVANYFLNEKNAQKANLLSVQEELATLQNEKVGNEFLEVSKR